MKSNKNNYYGNINHDVLNLIPLSANLILEIGCGQGRLGAAFKLSQPNAKYYGLEIVKSEAEKALLNLDDVACADIESPDCHIDRLFSRRIGSEKFDALVLGNVLEHLKDPWQVMANVREVMANDATCIVCLPNVSHWSVVRELLGGRWNYTDAGLLDKTHLRFFTLDTAIEMLQKSGWTVIDATPRIFDREKTQITLDKLLPIAREFNIDPGKLQQNLSAYQWVIRAVNGDAPKPLHVAAIGLKKFAGVTEARVDFPLTALKSLVGSRCVWGYGGISIPPDFQPGVLILHRQFMNDSNFNSRIELLIEKGWTVVADMDDDPNHWKQFNESNFYAYRCVHAVTVSSQNLANMITYWNPNVKVFPNAVLSLPKNTSKEASLEKKPLRVFFGALNRKQDWLPIINEIIDATFQLNNDVEFVVVHDKDFFDVLPTSCIKSFHPTLELNQYKEVLGTCDVALLPLIDNQFNRCKSDIKLIESAAASVAIICSKVVYGEDPRHDEFVIYADQGRDWKDAIVHLANNRDDLMRRQGLGLQYVKNFRMHSNQVVDRNNYYRELINDRPNLEDQRQARQKVLEKLG